MGTYLIVSGLFLMLKGKTAPQMLKDFSGRPSALYLSGILLVFFSAQLLLQDGIWDSTTRIVATIFSWLVLAKGLLYVFAPHVLEEITNRNLLTTASILGGVTIVAGISIFFFA